MMTQWMGHQLKKHVTGTYPANRWLQNQVAFYTNVTRKIPTVRQAFIAFSLSLSLLPSVQTFCYLSTLLPLRSHSQQPHLACSSTI